MNNLINIEESEEDSQIYRVLSVTRLLELFKTKENTLVRPKLWDDPFENYILNSLKSTSSEESGTSGFQKQLYGQCWTLKREPDAMWRIYSPDKFGARIRTKIKILQGSLYAQIPFDAESSVFTGKVLYKSQEFMVEQIQNRVEMQQFLHPEPEKIVNILLLKRTEFDHEKEVRVIYFNRTENDLGDLYKYPFDPYNIIDEIVFDPRMNDDLVEVFRDHFRSINYSGRISKSPLYQLPKLRSLI